MASVNTTLVQRWALGVATTISVGALGGALSVWTSQAVIAEQVSALSEKVEENRQSERATNATLIDVSIKQAQMQGQIAQIQDGIQTILRELRKKDPEPSRRPSP